jgi:pimeloyl-ACP methyl ester carboxylesterase
VYYCVSCNETIPNNSIEDYNADSNKFPKLKGGLSFYNSDFAVCEKWNSQKMNEVSVDSLMPKINVPTLIFSGEFDPITPSGNGSFLAAKIQDSKLIKATSYSHASSFTWTILQIQKMVV